MQRKYRMLALASATVATLVASAGSLTSRPSSSHINETYPEHQSATVTPTDRTFRLPWTRIATESYATARLSKVSADTATARAGEPLSEIEGIHKKRKMAERAQDVDIRSNNPKTNTDKAPIPGLVSDITLSLGKNICDVWVTTKVKLTLMFSANLNSAHIFIKTRNGMVTLAGNVPTETEHGLAIEIASQVHGVKSVKARSLVFPNEFQQFTIQDPANGLFLF